MDHKIKFSENKHGSQIDYVITFHPADLGFRITGGTITLLGETHAIEPAFYPLYEDILEDRFRKFHEDSLNKMNF